MSIAGLGCGVVLDVIDVLGIGDNGRGGGFTRRCRLACAFGAAGGIGTTEGNPIDDVGASISLRLSGVADCREPSRLRVFENKDVGDRSRILSSRVRVLGRDKDSV